MIREYRNEDLEPIMQIWLESNSEAHNFIDEDYWKQSYDLVKAELPKAKIYVNTNGAEILGFIGLQGNYIAGLFVKKNMRGYGIGSELLTYVKKYYSSLTLSVYEKNKGAVGFYGKHGFEVIKKKIDKNVNEEEYVMEWKNEN